MAKREQMNSEQMNEEFNRVEQELRQLTLDYNDTSKINDDLTKLIENKELELSGKDKFILELKNANIAELEQLKWVRISLPYCALTVLYDVSVVKYCVLNHDFSTFSIGI